MPTLAFTPKTATPPVVAPAANPTAKKTPKEKQAWEQAVKRVMQTHHKTLEALKDK